MDIHSTNQYLKKIRIEYLKTKSKKGKGRLLDEAEKRTGKDDTSSKFNEETQTKKT